MKILVALFILISLALLFDWWINRCPECGCQLDNDAHGVSHKWLHCHCCGWCSYMNHIGSHHNDGRGPHV